MREAVVMARQMVSGRTRTDLSDDPMLVMALTRCLEVLGEAAARLSTEARLRFPQVPCAKMVSMRNRLIHAYFDVDLDIVWTTVTEDLPPLLLALDDALGEIDK